MPTPVIVFDHINHVAVVTGVDPRADEKLAEALKKQRDLVSAAGGEAPPAR
jgi:hypothetical protein